jgi:hypothetical protein
MRKGVSGSRRPSRLGTRRLLWILPGLLTLLILPATAVAVPLPVTGAGGTGTKPTFKLPSLTPSFTLASSFWGADARVYYPANATLSQTFNATPLTFVRWPGGAVADAYNLTANRIYGTGGHSTTPASDIHQFAHWCAQLQCGAIVQLPAEIDSPSTAAFEVHYIESVVGFHPAFYEIGNEPAQWNHQGVAWANWTTTQRLNASPASYAAIVHEYVAAVHAVDPTARIIGLPGVGTGGYQETDWIRATVLLNGPNLSAVAIHVYPAGGVNGVGTAAEFYATLQGPGSLGIRVPADRAAIRNACPHCADLPLFITELGAGNAGGAYAELMGSFADVPYIAAEIADGMIWNVPNIDLFALQGSYGGSILESNAVLSPVGRFYISFLTQLGPGVLRMGSSGLVPGVHLVATRDSERNSYALLAVNTNTTVAQPIHLTGSLFPPGVGSVREWNLSTAGPSITFYPDGVPSDFVLPPQGVLVVRSDGVPSSPLGPIAPLPPRGPTAMIPAGGSPSGSSPVVLAVLALTPATRAIYRPSNDGGAGEG